MMLNLNDAWTSGKKFFLFGNHDYKLKPKDVGHHFQWMRHYHELKIGKTSVVLCHYPIHSWNKQRHGALHFYGHTHNSIPYVIEGTSKDIGVDGNDCYPHNIEDLVQQLQQLRETKNIQIRDIRYGGADT